MAPDGRELTYLSKEAISKAFHIPEFNNIIYKSKEAAQVVYDNDLDKCLGIINKYWLLKSRPSLSKMPTKLHKIDFKEEFGELLMPSNSRFGCSTS